jgi:hypothetical protein
VTTPHVALPAPVSGALVPVLPADTLAALATIGGAEFADAMAAQMWPLALALFDEFQHQESAARRRMWLERAADKFNAAHLAFRSNKHAAIKRAALRYVARLPIDVLSLIALPVGPEKAAVYPTEQPDWLPMDKKARERAAFLAYVDLAETMRERAARLHLDLDAGQLAEAKQRLDVLLDRATRLCDASAAAWIAGISAALRHPSVLRPNRKGSTTEAAELARCALPMLKAYRVDATIYDNGAAVRALHLVGAAACEVYGLKPRGRRSWRNALAEAIAK